MRYPKLKAGASEPALFPDDGMKPCVTFAAVSTEKPKPDSIDDGPDEFDWATDSSVVLKEQQATAVYHNKAGDIVIRQQARWSDTEDVFVVITAENGNAFMDGVAERLKA